MKSMIIAMALLISSISFANEPVPVGTPTEQNDAALAGDGKAEHGKAGHEKTDGESAGKPKKHKKHK